MKSDVPQQPQEQQAVGDIREILDAQRFAVLSTHDKGQPYASLVAFSAAKDLRRILFCTPRSTRKYANLSCDPRVAMLVHTGRNAAEDRSQAMAVTATGTAVEVPDGRKEADSAVFLTKHPGLSDFVDDPQNALLVVEVSEYCLVRRFQDVVCIRMELAAGAPALEGEEEKLRFGAAVVLLAHGSRDEAWRAWFEQVRSIPPTATSTVSVCRYRGRGA